MDMMVKGADRLYPSEHTGLLMSALRREADYFGRGKGLDMGVGSGVLLATLGLIGVRNLCGVDVDPQAIGATDRLMRELGLIERTRLLLGSLWEPLGEERFDVIAANLPHFPSTEPPDPRRSPTWSVGGADGRKLVDPFLKGLPRHLADTGVAFMTHDGFLGIDRTRAIAAKNGLRLELACASIALIPPEKLAKLSPDMNADRCNAGIRRLGSYDFTDVQILAIRHA
jgi:methylase of polypeptide subunit release factors